MPLRWIWALGLIALLAVGLQHLARAAVSPIPVRDWRSFTNTAAAQKQIDLKNPDTNLLTAAVFHATNHQRQQHKLKPLQFHRGAATAAAFQTRIMRDRGSISHENPERRNLKTPKDRAVAAGLTFKFIAENVAVVFGKNYESGNPYYTREEGGRKILSLTPTGPAIPTHTYASFAESLLRGWMNSPGHRANILHTEPQFLGVNSLPERDVTGLVKVYSAQVFYTPRDGQNSVKAAAPSSK